MSQETRGALRVAAGADPPLDKHVDELRNSPQVLCYMTPLPSGGGDHPKPNAPATVPDQHGPKLQAGDAPQKFAPRGGNKNKQRKTGESGGKTVKELLQAFPQKPCLQDGCWQIYLFALQQW